MVKLMPEKEEKAQAVDFGYNLGVYYRKKLIAWLKRLFRLS